MDLRAFAAVVVRVENETASVESFQQHGARGDHAVESRGGERHRLGKLRLCFARFLEPARELRERIRIEITFEQRLSHCTLLTMTGTNGDRKSTRLNSSHLGISYAVFCLKKKK